MTPVFLYISSFSGILPLLVGIYAYKYLKRDMKILLIYFALSFIVEIIAVYIAQVLHKHNIWLYNIFMIIEYSFFMVVISLWQKNKSIKKILQFSIPIFILIGIITQIYLESLNQFNNLTRPIESIIFTLVASFTLSRFSLEYSGQSLLKNHRFIILVGILIYFAGNTFLFALMGNELSIVKSYYFIIHSCLNIFAYLIFTWGFYCFRN